MTPGDPPPEIPPPGWPIHPQRIPDDPQPVIVPSVPAHAVVWPDDPVVQLRADRRLLLTGILDQETADRLCAELMLADGRSADPIELIINSPGGAVDAVPAVLDVIGLLRAPLTTRCIGAAGGTAAIVLASGTAGRSATPRATISLRLDGSYAIDGRGDDVRRAAAHVEQLWQRMAEHVAEVSAMTVDEAASALRDGSPLSATRARIIGLIDSIARH
ncbi:MAG TPA: ATP-dependent Clp protease proteolytic subunit [Euzebyales bacterium]